jgi:hypothetical protein
MNLDRSLVSLAQCISSPKKKEKAKKLVFQYKQAYLFAAESGDEASVDNFKLAMTKLINFYKQNDLL